MLGELLGILLGALLGILLGELLGILLGEALVFAEGLLLGTVLGALLGALLGTRLGVELGFIVGPVANPVKTTSTVASLFTNEVKVMVRVSPEFPLKLLIVSACPVARIACDMDTLVSTDVSFDTTNTLSFPSWVPTLIPVPRL